MQEVTKNHYPKRIARILLKTVLFLALFIILIFFLLLFPPVQKFLTGRVENYLEKKLETNVTIRSISFGLSGNLHLQDIYLEDRQKDTLLYGESIKANLSLLKLFSNEVQVKDIELLNIYANIKRTLPDTAFNFQFIVDAFMADRKKNPDTAQTAPLKFNLNDLSLENVRLRYNDVVTGSDMFANIGNFTIAIDRLDPDSLHFDFSSVIGRNITATIKQHKPLLQPESLQQDVAEASQPLPLINVGIIDFTKLKIQFDNNISSVFSNFNIGRLKAETRNIDLQNNLVHLESLELNNSTSVIRLGRSQGAKVVEKEIKKEVAVQAQKGWRIKADKLAINNNNLKFDNDNTPPSRYGMDYAHLDAKNLFLHAENLIIATDSIGGNIAKGSFTEKSGFVLEELRGNVLYAYNQSYLKDLYIKTPGSVVRRNLVLDYASFDELVNNFPRTVMNVEIENSRLQVKDILVFAPQLRNNPAFSNPSDIWDLHMVGSGTLNNLNIEDLRFAGLRNTIINANGRLTGLMNPEHAGGNFTIHQLKTSQSDIAVFTGQRLSTAEINLPETFSASGTINGNAGQFQTNLSVNSSAGSATVRGSFSQLANPAKARYNATISTSGLALGSILRQQGTIGSISGVFTFNGSGFTPASMNTKFTANISSLGYNQYRYRNIRLAGNVRQNHFTSDVDINDPNVDLDLVVSGNLGTNASYRIDGMVDSIKTLPLNFTPEPLVFRGQINGTISSLTPDYLDANLLITRALFVSNENRLPLDSIEFISGHTDTSSFMRLRSDVANANIEGQYRFSELGSIVQSSIQPYFSVTPPARAPNLHPYNFRFRADVHYSPIFSSFIPGLTAMETLHAEGSFVMGEGVNAVLTTPHLSLQGNEVSDLNVRVLTTEKGLEVRTLAGHLKSGSFDVFNTRFNATALNNVIDFNLGIDDAGSKNKYFLSGMLRQPSQGVFAISLRPDSLLLNYDLWTVPQNNMITISPESITASNFVLQRGEQKLSIASVAGQGQQPLQLSFESFRLGTITGFIKSDSLIADGLINGQVTFQNLRKQPSFTSNLTISDFSMQKDTLGNLNLVVNTAAGNRFNTNLTLSGRGNDVVMNGYFIPSGNDLDLNLDLNIRQLDLSSIEGATNQALTNASGSVNGQVKIMGKLSAPVVRGDVNFDNASFAMTLLGSQFYINNETLSVTENGLKLDNFTIRDSAGNQLTLNGDILTKNYTNYRFGMTLTARNFLILNSEKQKNSLYYGRLNISSDLRINGTEINPIIDGNLTVNEGTNLSIVVPQLEPGVQQREGVVQFVNLQQPEMDTLFKRYDSLNFANVLGMDIAANIEVRKEAILNVIIDEANGDFLNVQGEALLSAGVDPSGKITLVGNYTLEEGAYEISFDLLRRRFEIEKGSTITWTGEPTTARLDVEAVYVANTAPLDLVQDQISAPNAAIRNTYLQKLPFEVRLSLTGELLKPEIDFDIVLPENRNYGVSNDIVTLVQARLNQLRQDEGSINKQVFSLLLLGRFVGENPFEASGDNFELSRYARQSVSKLLTEQLNQLAAGLIGGIEIDFDVASTDDYTTGDRRSRTDLNIGLSKRLLNDRLRVSVGSNFQLEGPQNSNQQDNNIAGNVAVDYHLSKDGRYMLRYFRRNQYEGVVDGYIIENGLSFILSVDYNRFREVLKRKRQRVTRMGTTETTSGQ